MRSAQVLQQEQATIRIGLVHVGDMRPKGLEQPRHLQIGPNASLPGGASMTM